ncbi:MAG: sensor histidine kinase [Longimicrobiales bacterium]
MAVLLAVPAAAHSQTLSPGKRVLWLYGQDPSAPGAMAFWNGLHDEVVRSEGPGVVEFYTETLDFTRFPGQEHFPQLAAVLHEKYRSFRFDAIVVAGSRALRFAVTRLQDVFPGVPIVYGVAFEPVVDFDALPAHVTGRSQPLTFTGTLALAKRLQPDAERVILIGGAASMDSVLLTRAIGDLTPLLGNLELVAVRDWTYASLLGELRKLPQRSIGILSSFSGDQTGQHFNSGDLIASVTRASSIPLYGIVRNWVGDGIVGGSVMAFADDGLRTGRLLVKVLNRRPGEPLPAREVADTPLVVDFRQLENWGLSERLLPPGTEVLFRTPTIWARYWHVILAALALMSAQSVLITMLLLERRRRVRAQRVMEESRAQVAHIARVATLGELAAAVSHELRQPLAAIRAHAVAGGRLLDQTPPDLGETREVFRDIVEDNERATEVLEHIRALLRKEEPVCASVDLNAVCTRAVQLLHSDAVRRGVRLDLSLDPERQMVTGDAVQLQQVVLNLAVNAMDALQTTGQSQRVQDEVVVGTSASGNGTAEIFVRDTGPGLSPEVQQRIFEPFYSTKSQGLGMGLAIVRSIVERHQGHVSGENVDTGGAVFRVRLPVEEKS